MLPADPRAGYLAHRAEIDQAIHRVLDQGFVYPGAGAAGFAEEFARYVGVSGAVGVGNGTDALHLALRACGVGPGDAVITVSHTAVATVAAIELAGAAAVLVDVDPSHLYDGPWRAGRHRSNRLLQIRAGAAPASQGRHPRSPVWIPGRHAIHPGNRQKVRPLRHRGLCSSAWRRHRRTEDRAWGDVSAFSFYPTKNLGAWAMGALS